MDSSTTLGSKRKLPGQKENAIFNPDEERQTKITIITFTKYARLGGDFAIDRIDNDIKNYITMNHFFNKKNMRQKRARGSMHLTRVQTDQVFYRAGARHTVIIRPKLHPDINIHTIQRDFNESLPKGRRLATLWVREAEIENFKGNNENLQLYLKVLDYESERAWESSNAGLPIFDQVADYKDNIGTGSRR